MPLRRRNVLLGAALSVVATACGRVQPRPTPAPIGSSEVLDASRQTAQAMLSDALRTLRTFEVYVAFRTGGAQAALAWDPPSSAAWDSATATARGLHAHADQLMAQLTMASVDPTLWREQRALAQTAHDLGLLGEALQAFRDRADRLPAGEVMGSVSLLDSAWTKWDALATQFGMSRGEAIGCG